MTNTNIIFAMPDNRTEVLYVDNRGVSYPSTFTDSEAQDFVCSLIKAKILEENQFICKIAYTYLSRLTGNQIKWLHILAAKEILKRNGTNTVAIAAAVPAVIDCNNLLALMFGNGKLKKPTLYIRNVRFSVCGGLSKNPGDIRIVNKVSELFYGRISRTTGEFIPSSQMTRDANFLPLMEKIAANPVETIASEGRITGVCCFCGLGLSDPESVKVGYGRVCAKNRNLPHAGNKTKAK